MTQSTDTLAYADLPSQWGVTVDNQPDQIRIVIPPVPSWRHLPRAYNLGFIPVIVAIWIGVMAQTSHELVTVLPAIAGYAFCSVGVLLLAMYRLHARRIIDVTAETVTITSITSFTHPGSITWRKREISDIKMNPNNGKMLLRITGKSMPEFFISANRQVTEWVVDTVRNAAFNEHFDVAPNSEISEFAKPRVSRASLRPGIVVAMGNVVLGFGLMLSHQTAIFGGLLFGVSVVAVIVIAGITFGTQEKELFF